MTNPQRWQPSLGAILQDDGNCLFRVWAPHAKAVDLHLIGKEDRYISMERGAMGYFRVTVDSIKVGQRYKYRLDGGDEYPDPASRYQPEGVFGPSYVDELTYAWTDQHWRGLPLEQYIIYELHVGTYTPEGTFEAVIGHLDDLVELGITAIELMPVFQFPGDRNWGYDGVFPFAIQQSYGGPDGFCALVDACHAHGIAVIVDVVYNHLGPEGNCLVCYGPYTTDKYKGPWGDSMNFDDAYSDEVRAFFTENALYLFNEFHIDALRLDATHFMYDFRAVTFLEELIQTVHQHRELLGRHIYLMAEDDRNDAKLLASREVGGWEMDAQWNDDFHHSMYSLVTSEGKSYYQGFGSLESVVKAMREGFVFTGQYSDFRNRRHGTSSADTPAYRFIIFTQNHDQIGNHIPAERMNAYVSFDNIKLMLGMVALSPYIPMIFMGEEYGEPALFNFFTSFETPSLIEAVQKGRKEAFAAFTKAGHEPPDPQATSTFEESKLNHNLREHGKHKALLDLHRTLFGLRKSHPALRELRKDWIQVLAFEAQEAFVLRRWNGNHEIVAAFNVKSQPATLTFPITVGYWDKLLDSASPRWAEEPSDAPEQADALQSLGQLTLTVAPQSFVLYSKQE